MSTLLFSKYFENEIVDFQSWPTYYYPNCNCWSPLVVEEVRNSGIVTTLKLFASHITFEAILNVRDLQDFSLTHISMERALLVGVTVATAVRELCGNKYCIKYLLFFTAEYIIGCCCSCTL